MTREMALALMRSMSRDDDLEPAQALLDLLEVLARTHETMDNDDWEKIAIVGALLWRTEMGDIEAQGEFEMLMRRVRK
jgi:hypothetical protein